MRNGHTIRLSGLFPMGIGVPIPFNFSSKAVVYNTITGLLFMVIIELIVKKINMKLATIYTVLLLFVPVVRYNLDLYISLFIHVINNTINSW